MNRRLISHFLFTFYFLALIPFFLQRFQLSATKFARNDEKKQEISLWYTSQINYLESGLQLLYFQWCFTSDFIHVLLKLFRSGSAVTS